MRNQGLIGRVLNNQFRVDAFVASGGMGVVYRVWDIKRNVHLAMKVLHEDLAEDPSIFKRFRREAHALEKLTHPNIVPFYGLYESQGIAFLLESYVDGPSLKHILRHYKGKPMPVEEVLIYLKALSSALGYAHAHGVVHCDVKPGNVMVDRGGVIYLTDFGVARHAESTVTTLGFAGTAAYMAPEQIRGEAVTAQTDVYALGVILFEMLTGRRLFKGDERETEGHGSTRAERMRYGHLYLKPPNPKSINPELSEEVNSLILKALEKTPRDRLPNVVELYHTVCAALAVMGATVEERVTLPNEVIHQRVEPHKMDTHKVGAPQQLPAGRPVDEVAKLGKKASTHIAPIVVGAVVTLSAIILAIIFVGGGNSHQASQTHTSGIISTGITSTSTSAVTRISPTGTTVFTPTTAPSLTPEATQPEPGTIQINPIDSAEVVFIPEGDFTMGLNHSQIAYLLVLCPDCKESNFENSLPVHQVGLNAYWIYQNEVTNEQYQRCVASSVCRPPAESESGKRNFYYGNPSYHDYPVVYVNWYAASEYCRWAGGRLPTEAEWEKAARGTDGRIFPWGDEEPNSKHGNFWPDVEDTAAVGSYPLGGSPYGVLDMAGNVWEWVADWFDPNAYDGSYSFNPTGPTYMETNRKSGRGGSWGWVGSLAASGLRDSWEPQEHGSGVGFRCVLDRVP